MRVSLTCDDETTTVDAALVVFSVGVRPRDELARAAGLDIAERGGVLTDRTCRTSDPHIWAIGECAAIDGTCYGLVGPGYASAEVAAARIVGDVQSEFTGADLATKLKLMGVDVASFGDAHASTPGCHEVVVDDPLSRTYSKLVMGHDSRTLLGGEIGRASCRERV